MAVGMLLKGAVLLLWHFASLRPVLRRSTDFDGTVWLAFKTCNFLFDPRREIPAPREPATFYSMLILGLGLEWLCLGFVVEASRHWFKSQRPHRLPTPR
jgi:hypothetical protein